MKAITDSQRADALRILHADYWQDVRSFSDSFRDCVVAGEIESEDDAQTWLHETIDSCARVIYTGQAIETLLFCESDDEADDCGIVLDSKNPARNYSVLAFFGLRGDVRKQIAAQWDLSELDDDETRAEMIAAMKAEIESEKSAA